MSADDTTSELALVMSEILNSQEALVERIETLEHELAQRPAGAGSPATTTEGESGDDDDLDTWVEWLIDTYYLELVIPTAWADQPAVRAELEALHRAHTAAYADQASGWDKLTWHDHLARVLDRIDPSHTPGYTQRLRDRTLND